MLRDTDVHHLVADLFGGLGNEAMNISSNSSHPTILTSKVSEVGWAETWRLAEIRAQSAAGRNLRKLFKR